MKGAVSAQKALEWPEMETRELLGGTEEKSIPRRGVIDSPFRQVNDLSQKGKKNRK